MHVNKFICIALLFSLVSCASTEPIKIETVQVSKTPLNLSYPNPIHLSPVEWVVITPGNATEVFEKLKTEKTDEVLFGLSDDAYKNLSVNMAIIKKYIIEIKTLLNSYKDYYENPEELEESSDTNLVDN